MAYTTTVADMIEGQPMSREAYKNLTLKIANEWVKINHPEIKAEWIDICTRKQEIIAIFPDKKKSVKKRDKDGNVITKLVTKRDGSVVEVDVTEEIPYPAGETRYLTAFEIFGWLCNKYNMSPEVKKVDNILKSRAFIGNW